MSAKSSAILTYILVSMFIMLIEYSSGVPLNIYHYLNLIIEEFSNTVTPTLPTTGNWADSANNVISMMNILKFLLRVLSSPIPLIAAIIVYLKDEKGSVY
jgi:hypothetical protein